MELTRNDKENRTGEKIIIGKHNPTRFNIMVAGESGQGKTTFLKALLRKYSHNGNFSSINNKTERTLEISEMGSFVFEADIGKCAVFLYDTPGYGESLNSMDGIKHISDNLNSRQLAWRNMDAQTMTTAERNHADTRIHCVFYFIAAHRLKPIDLEFISRITPLAPIVPIIAKADTMTSEERRVFLCEVYRKIRELQSNFSLPVTYDFCEEGYDFISDENAGSTVESDLAFSAYVNVGDVLACGSPENIPGKVAGESDMPALPKIRNIFAVVCDNSPTNCRTYPWGTLQMNEERHSDFRRLQRLIFENGRHIMGMMEQTQDRTILLYAGELKQEETYRQQEEKGKRFQDEVKRFQEVVKLHQDKLRRQQEEQAKFHQEIVRRQQELAKLRDESTKGVLILLLGSVLIASFCYKR